MRIKKLLKIVAITVVSIAVLLFLAVAAFVYNPFEGSLPDMRDVVPRDVDFYVRKPRLADDFQEFPRPHFWSQMEETAAFEDLMKGPTARDVNRNGAIAKAAQSMQAQVEDIRRQSKGMFDPLRDLLGQDVILAGNFAGRDVGDADWCAYTRMTWRGRFGFGLLGYSFMQEQLKNGGLGIEVEGETFKLTPQGGKPLHIGRHLDCLMIASSSTLLERSLELAKVGESDTFGGTSTYDEGIRRPILDWQEETGSVANAVEIFVKPDSMFERTAWDDNWPNRNNEDSMNERVLASFLNLKTWRFLTGALLFEEQDLTFLGDIELNQNKHTPFQSQFFRVEKQARSEWLDPFLQMVPADACAAAALRMPAGDFMREMFNALDPATQSLVNEALQKTGKFQSMLQLIEKLEVALYPRTGFVFRRKVADKTQGAQLKVAVPSPVPHVAWVFWLREKESKIVNDVLKQIKDYHKTLGFEGSYKLNLALGPGGSGRDEAAELAHAQIEGTGSIAFANYSNYLILSNSGPFIRDLTQTYLGRAKGLDSLEDFTFYEKQLDQQVNGVVYLNGKQLDLVLQDYEVDTSMFDNPNPEWAMQNRSAIEGQVFRSSWSSRYRAIAQIPRSEKLKFDGEVDTALRNKWRQDQSGYTAQAKAGLREAISFVRLFRSAYFQVSLDPRHIRFKGSITPSFIR